MTTITATTRCEWCGEPADDELGPVTGHGPANEPMHAGCASTADATPVDWDKDAPDAAWYERELGLERPKRHRHTR